MLLVRRDWPGAMVMVAGERAGTNRGGGELNILMYKAQSKTIR